VASTAASVGMDIGFGASARSNATKEYRDKRRVSTYVPALLLVFTLEAEPGEPIAPPRRPPAPAPRYNKKGHGGIWLLRPPPRQGKTMPEPWSSSCPTPQPQQRTLVAPPWPHGQDHAGRLVTGRARQGTGPTLVLPLLLH